MKAIKELFYRPNYLGVNLTDIPASIIIAYLDGSISFNEGWGEDRIEKAALGGENVDRFEIESGSNGMVQVILQYRAHYSAQEEIRRHLIGLTKDKEKAEAWVTVANQICKDRKNNQKLAEAAS